MGATAMMGVPREEQSLFLLPYRDLCDLAARRGLLVEIHTGALAGPRGGRWRLAGPLRVVFPDGTGGRIVAQAHVRALGARGLGEAALMLLEHLAPGRGGDPA